MNIFGKMFGSDKIQNAMINGIDSIVYTEEERKENQKEYLKLYEPFKIGQRYLALIFGVPFAFLHTLAFTIRLSFYNNEKLQQSIQSIQSDLNDHIGVIVITIVIFYFGAGATEGVINKLKGVN